MLDVGDVDGDAGTFACFLNLTIVCGDGLMTSVFVTLSEACLRVAPGALCAHVAQALHSSGSLGAAEPGPIQSIVFKLCHNLYFSFVFLLARVAWHYTQPCHAAPSAKQCGVKHRGCMQPCNVLVIAMFVH